MVIYLVTVLGNLGFITLIRSDTRLHTPMYYFLSHLAFVDLCYSSTITPKMMVNFVVEHNTILFHACATQLGCFLIIMIMECFLLASMAYDRYVAICSPLRYSTWMSKRICIQLVAVPYMYSFLVALFHTYSIITFCLTYCAPMLLTISTSMTSLSWLCHAQTHT